MMAEGNGSPQMFEMPVVKRTQFKCPAHGVTDNVINSNIPGHEGVWCQICWIDSFERSGIMRCEPVEADNAG